MGASVGEAERLRVVLVGCEGVLGDIIRHAVTEAPDLNVVATLPAVDVGPDTLTGEADLVLWNDANESRLECLLTHVTRRHGTRVLATLSDGRDAALWEVVLQRTPLGALSSASLVDAIRTAAARGGEDV